MHCGEIVRKRVIEDEEQRRFIAETAKKTLAYLAKSHIDLTPQNYEEWFFVVCKAQQEQHLLSEKNLKVLYEKYFDDKKQEERKEQEEMREIAETLKDLAQESDSALDQFAFNIDTHSHYINESIDAITRQDIQKIESLKQKIIALEEENKKLREYLEENRQKLEIIEEKFYEQKREAEVDPHTGLFNRRTLEKDIEKIHKAKIPYSLLVGDVDNFKKINDTYGHLVGDEVLKIVGDVLKNYVRKNTKCYRYGGEEFVIVLPYANRHGANVVGERLRGVIENRAFQLPDGSYLHFTISFGGTEREGNEDFSTVFARADKALYEAKKSGKNRTVIL